MTLDEIIEVVTAAKQGKPIQYKPHGCFEWSDCSTGYLFNFEKRDYRVKPRLTEWYEVRDENGNQIHYVPVHYPNYREASKDLFSGYTVVHVKEITP